MAALLARISHTHRPRKGSTRRSATAGTAWSPHRENWAASGRHSPPKAGGGKDSPFRGGPLSAGISAFGGIHPREWQTPFVAVRATCLRSVKADGKEPPVTLGSLCRVPPGETRMISPSAHQARQKMPRHSRWLGAASSVLVSRSRAYRPEAGPVLPVGAPSRSYRCAVGHTASHLLGGGTCRDGSHPGDGGLRRRGPAGRCAGRRPAQFSRWGLQAVPAMAPSALRALGSIRAVGVRLRLLFTATGGRSVSPIHTPSRRSAPARYA